MTQNDIGDKRLTLPRHPRALGALAALAFSACAQLQLAGAWQNPAVAPPHYSSFVVLTTLNRNTLRQSFEDAFVAIAQGHGIRAVPGYSILNEAPDVTAQEVEASVRAAGTQAAIVVSVIRTAVVTDTGPGYVSTSAPVWGVGYDGYYTTTGWAYAPDTYSVSVDVQLRMNVYDAATKQLVWSAITNTVPRDQISQDVYSIAQMLLNGLYKHGILVPASP